MDNTRGRWMTWIAAFLIMMATMIGIATAGDRYLAIDLRIAQQNQRWQGNVPDVLEHIGDMLGETATAIAAVVAGIAISTILRAWREAAFFVVVGVFRLAGTGLKPLFESPRPSSSQVRIHDHADGFGYPSGHSMTAAMLATMVVIIAWHTPGATRDRWLITALAAALTMLVGWSRIWSGAHWPTDVIGGWSFGAGLVLLAWVVTTRVAHLRTG